MPRKTKKRKTQQIRLASRQEMSKLYLLPPAELRSGLLGDGRYRWVPATSRTNL